MIYNSQLDTFLVVAKEGSFSAAGEKLYISASAVNQQISALESGLGVELFSRSRQGLELTKAGAYFLSEVPSIIDHCRQTELRLKEIKETELNTITVGIPHMHKIRLFYEYWAAYTMQHETGKIQLVAPNSWEEKDVFRTYSGCDLVEYIDIGAAWQKNRDFVVLEQVPVGLSVPENNPLSEYDKITLDMLRGTELAAARGAFTDKISDGIQLLKELGVTIFWQEWYTADMMDECFLNRRPTLAIKSGKGIHPGFRLVHIDWDVKVPYGFSVRRGGGPALSDFLKFVDETKELKD